MFTKFLSHFAFITVVIWLEVQNRSVGGNEKWNEERRNELAVNKELQAKLNVNLRK